MLDTILPDTADALVATVRLHVDAGPACYFAACQLLHIAATCLVCLLSVKAGWPENTNMGLEKEYHLLILLGGLQVKISVEMIKTALNRAFLKVSSLMSCRNSDIEVLI